MKDKGEKLQPLGRADISHRRPTNLDRFYFGAPYYPEHWDAGDRAPDAGRMAEAGFNVVRMAEFAWDRLEPREGVFDFSLFDETIAALGAKGIFTILCTPTATPPRWLTAAHPEVLRVNAEGVPMQHGSRQHCCHAGPTFREYSRRIAGAMAGHYKDNPHVVGWQTDNEFHCHFQECHCRSCQEGFRTFLRGKYGSIDRLNAAWGTAFWALTFDDFDQIETVKINRPAHPNPAQELDYYRYLADAVAHFQHDQVEILRAAQPKWWITHNGIFRHMDGRGLFSRDLDFLGVDIYPFFSDPARVSRSQAYTLDRARAWAGNLIVPEQQSGPGGQRPFLQDTPEPGEMRRMDYLSIARGADSLLHFRWRTCRFGAEEYWRGLLDHDNVPRRRYEEAARIGRELKVVGPEVLGTSVRVEAAVADADMEVNDAHTTYHMDLPMPTQIAQTVHGVLHDRGYAAGVIHPCDDLAGVKLYIIPHWAYFDPAWARPLRDYVENGGTLVIGARTATRDVNNNVVAETIPGVLRDLAGVTVEEYGKRGHTELRPVALNLPKTRVENVETWYEVLEPFGGATTIGTWEGRHLTGLPAITRRSAGKGSVFYVGTYLTGTHFEALLPEILKTSGLEPLWPETPPGVSVTVREDREKQLWFFINHNDAQVHLPSTPQGTDLITGEPAGTELRLEPNGVAVIRA